MKLVDHLETVISAGSGYVAVQLAKEDLKRVQTLRELAHSSDNLAAMQKSGLYIGWTKGDFRTHELKDPLNAIMEIIYTVENDKPGPEDRAELDAKIMDIWAAFHTLRLKTLVHCL
ncbi:MAG: hypothetical protein HKO02_03135 [Hyphomonadaceae bacterium]|nr:hypothetical protein [Hyphomonadaceae bacterium]